MKSFTHVNGLIQEMGRREFVPKLGAEFGVWRGSFSMKMLDHFSGLTLLLVDPWELANDGGGMTNGSPDRSKQMKKLMLQNTEKFIGRCVVFQMFSVQAAKMVADRLLDFVFIDARHTYKNVLEDIRVWVPKVRKGGVISGHDYGGNFTGVQRAVNQYVEETGCELKLLPGKVWMFMKESSKDC